MTLRPISPPRFRAPGLVDDRPPDVDCIVCGEPVPPYEAPRGGWLPRTRHDACRVRQHARERALDIARAGVESLPRKHRHFSLRRWATMADTEAPADALRLHGGNAKAHGILSGWEPGQSVVVEGPTGTGKTALLVAFARDQMLTLTPQDTTRAVRYFSEPDLAEFLKTKMLSKSKDDYIARVLSGHVLVIDDVGTARVTEWWDATFSDLLDHAYRQERTIVLSTNLPIKALGQHYTIAGDRMPERLHEMTGQGSRWVTVGGVNWRRVTA